MLAQVAMGDKASFTRLFDAFSDKVYSFAYHFSKSDADAKDAVQDIFLRIFLRRESLAGIQDFDAYLFRCARNRFLNIFKQSARIVLKEDFTETDNTISETPLDALETKEMTASLHAAMDKLPSKQKQTYILRKEEGQSTRETAESMGISEVTVKEHLGKALKTLRKIHLDYNNPTIILLLGSFLPLL